MLIAASDTNTALIGVAGALVGALLAGLMSVYLEWRRETRRREAGLDLVKIELEDAASTLDAAISQGGWWPKTSDIQVTAWSDYRGDLTIVDSQTWDQLARTYRQLESLKAWAATSEAERASQKAAEVDPRTLPSALRTLLLDILAPGRQRGGETGPPDDVPDDSTDEPKPKVNVAKVASAVRADVEKTIQRLGERRESRRARRILGVGLVALVIAAIVALTLAFALIPDDPKPVGAAIADSLQSNTRAKAATCERAGGTSQTWNCVTAITQPRSCLAASAASSDDQGSSLILDGSRGSCDREVDKWKVKVDHDCFFAEKIQRDQIPKASNEPGRTLRGVLGFLRACLRR